MPAIAAQVTRTSVRSPGVRDAIMLGGAGALVSVAGSWIPSLWHDEAATVSAATRTLPELLHMLASVDAVHGLYYALMHVWTTFAGASPFAIRLPSAIAAGLAAAALVLLVGRAGSRAAAILSGVVLILLPRFTWAGLEARSPAITMLLAVVLTAVLLEASRRRDRAPWVAYGILLVLGVLVFLDLALIVPAHAVTLLLLRRGLPRGYLAATGVAALVLAPFAALVVSQREQLFWVPRVGAGSWHDALVEQYFGPNWALAVVAGAVLVAGLFLARPFAPVLATALPALVLPLTALLIASVVIEPLYVPRYLAFTTPALAACLGVALAGVRRAGVAAAVVIALVAAPTVIAQRLPEAKDSAWQQVAQIVEENRADDAEGVAWGTLTRFPRVPARAIGVAYPDAFAGLADLTLRVSAAASGTLWGVDDRIEPGELAGLDAVWVIGADDRWTNELELAGFARTAVWHELELEIVRYERDE